MRHRVRQIIAATLAVTLFARPACGYIIPTFNPNKYGSFVSELQSIDKQIKSWAEVVGAIRTQIDTLQNVTNSIYQLKSVIRESVRGVAGSIAQQVGINEVLAPLGELQRTYTDAMYLYRDIKNLPEEARRQMEQIGFSVKDVQNYLRDGVAYDTFSGLGMDDWKQVGKNPWRAFENGTVGMAIMRSEYYLGEGSRGEAWGRYLDGLSPAEKSQMGAVLGPAYALFASGEWFDDMGKRVQQATNYRTVANKLADRIQPTGEVSAQPAEAKSVVEDLQTRNAVVNLNVKTEAVGMANDAKAQNAIVTGEAARLEALRQADRLDRQDDAAAAMIGGGK